MKNEPNNLTEKSTLITPLTYQIKMAETKNRMCSKKKIKRYKKKQQKAIANFYGWLNFVLNRCKSSKKQLEVLFGYAVIINLESAVGNIRTDLWKI